MRLPALALSLLLAAGAAAQGFLAQADDVPLMAGLAEVPGSGVMFDKPGGRIVEAYAAGPVAAREVRRFYDRSLPPLGWQRRGDLMFEREGERLQLSLAGRDGQLTVRYEIVPR